jgi:hypothetical protein
MGYFMKRGAVLSFLAQNRRPEEEMTFSRAENTFIRPALDC